MDFLIVIIESFGKSHIEPYLKSFGFTSFNEKRNQFSSLDQVGLVIRTFLFGGR